MATYNGTLKKWNATGSVWDLLYPKTTGENIISGTINAARIPTLDGSKIGTGTIDAARLPAIAMTNVVTYTTLSAFVTAYQANHNLVQAGDVVVLTTDKKTYIHNGGTAWTSADLTLMQTPTDVVTSVQGKVGVVTLYGSEIATDVNGNFFDQQDPLSASLYQLDIQVKANQVAITGKAPTVHTHTKSQITDLPAMPVGAIVGTTDIQTLSNKTFSNATYFGSLVLSNNRITSDDGHITITGPDYIDFDDNAIIGVAYATGASPTGSHAANVDYVNDKQIKLVDSVSSITTPVDGQLAFEY